MRKASIPLLALLLATAAGAAPAGDAPKTFRVGARGEGARFEAPGQVRAVRQAVLAAQAGGRITEVLVRSGEAVKRGQVLLRIDAPAARATAEAADAQAAAAAAQLASARADFARTERLHERAYVSDAGLQRAAAQLQAVEAQSTAASAQARAARETAGWDDLRAPYDGRITSVSVAPGDLASPGQPLVGVYAPGPMRVLADVPEETAAALATDQPVRLAYAAGGCSGAPEEARSWTLVPAIDSRSRSVGVRVELPDPNDCVPGVLVRVSLPLRGARQGLAVPRDALIRRGELDAVYVVDARGQAALRQVRIGEASGESVEVLAGVEAGEEVLREAAHYRPTAPGTAARP